MSYVVKAGELYLSADGWITSQLHATKYATKDKARADIEADDERVVRLKPLRSHLSRDVAEFHAMIGEPAPKVPMVPDSDAVRMRLALVLEETIELLEAAGVYRPLLTQTQNLLCDLRADIVGVRPDIVAMTDALADVAYVVEGSFQRFGVDSGPVLAEVHRSNMSKRGAGKDANCKWQKPKGWTPPDIAGELRKQGWRGGAK